MTELHGPISDRLRKLFAKDDHAWTPQRPGPPAIPPKIPKDVEGIKMTGRKK